MQLNRVQKRFEDKPDGGYSLAEVLIAVVVLALIAMAFYAGLSSGFLITQAAREDLRATQIMAQRMEGLRLCSWNQISNYTFQERYDPLATGSGGGVVYWGRVSIGPAGDIPSGVTYKDRMCLVTVTLSWTNSNGRIPMVHARTMQTQVAQYGLQSYVWGGFRQNPVFYTAGQSWEVAP